jgi:hypothetical protein
VRATPVSSFSFKLATDKQTRTAGVTAIALVFFAAASACAVMAACTAAGVWPLAWGRYLVGELATMGPALLVIASLLYALIGFGLLWLKNWARRLAIVVSAVGLYFLAPTISSAVVDLRFLAIVSNGAQIIARVVVLWYLLQEKVAAEFLGTSNK